VAVEEAKIAELRALVDGIRDRVRAQFPDGSATVQTGADSEPIQVPLADLMPVVHARDAAQAKMASIGSVNPRRGGLVNNTIQSVKRTVARGLGWFVRDQIVFNRGALACVEALMEAVNELNRSMSSLAAQMGTRMAQDRADHRADVEPRLREAELRARDLLAEARKLTAVTAEWHGFRAGVLKSIADGGALHDQRSLAVEQRILAMEQHTRELVKAQHGDFTLALERGTHEIQALLWKDMERIRMEFERTIHAELRTIRQRGVAAIAAAAPVAVQPAAADFDYQAFSDRFRGSEENVRAGQQFYVPHFQGAREVLDIGCGRGEFLDVMRENGIAARGIDLSSASVEYCRGKGLRAEEADLFEHLAGLADHSLAAIFCSQVVEHLPPERLPEMIRLCAAKLERGGLVAIETPNPECLAIFASHFYLDPTHTRPVPHALLAFYFEEFGMGAIETRKRSPAVESWPELRELPEGVRERFFGGLDYAIFARKL
jgi:2-polyprenyl-3-methyl-5-hydroxy-6-metoxy-1,4-benzoquinol methylase